MAAGSKRSPSGYLPFTKRSALNTDIPNVNATLTAPAPLLSEPGLSSVPTAVPAAMSARDVSVWFSKRNILQRVSIDFPENTVTALIGPSGCGKSTFLRTLNRLHELAPGAALAGEVHLNGQDVYATGVDPVLIRQHVGMVFQKPNPFPSMTIRGNVLSGLRLSGLRRPEHDDDIVEEALTHAGLWNEVKDRLKHHAGDLSGGQQQRLVIARALAIQPRVLLMDEPCSALDPRSTLRIEETIRELSASITIVIVTHNMGQAQRVADYTGFFLADENAPGTLIEHGPTIDVFSNPHDQRTLDYVNGRFG